MQFGLNEEQQLIVDTVRQFVEQEIYPHEDSVEKSGVVAPELGDSIKQKLSLIHISEPTRPY